MTQALAIDLSRLFMSALRPTPRGIDRIEIMYAKHFLASWPGPCFALLPTPWGVRLFDRQRALRGTAALETLWGESESIDLDKTWHSIDRWLQGDRQAITVGAPQRGVVGSAIIKLCLDVGPSFGAAVRTTLPKGAIYLNVGHISLSNSRCLAWLNDRRDVKSVFMLHDVIPLEYPKYVSEGELRYFKRILSSLGLADGLILTTCAVADSVSRLLPHIDCRTLISPLPLAPIFWERRAQDVPIPSHPYFVACGQVESRKNHVFLVRLWRELRRQMGPVTPKLLIAGAAGDASNEISSELDAWDHDRQFVLELAGLHTPHLIRLLRGATALLMPSFAEGFGIPIIEALSLETPVIASDIPAHRETGADYAICVGATDTNGWRAAVQSLIDPSGAAARRAKIKTYRPRTSSEYMNDVELFLKQFADKPKFPSPPGPH